MVQIAKQVMGKLTRLQDGNPDTGLPRTSSERQSLLAARTGRRAEAPARPLRRSCFRWRCRARRTTRAAFAGRSSATASKDQARRSGRVSSRPQMSNAPAGDQALAFSADCLHVGLWRKRRPTLDGLHAAGFRILPEDQPDFPFWSEGDCHRGQDVPVSPRTSPAKPSNTC